MPTTVSNSNLQNLESYHYVVSRRRINSTVSLVHPNRHPAPRYYHAHSASGCRTAFASVAHRAACQACPWRHLAMLWLVPGSERAWSARSPVTEIAVRRARCARVVVPGTFTSKRSQPSSWAHASVACRDRAPDYIDMYAPRRLSRQLLWETSHQVLVSLILVCDLLVVLCFCRQLCSVLERRRLCDLRRQNSCWTACRNSCP